MAVKAVTIGFFDGVHIGHRRVLNTLLSRDPGASVVTFWPHPRTVLQQDARGLCMLNSLDEKKALIEACGVGDIRFVDFTREFASLTAEQFIEDYLIGKLGCTDLVLGYDNRLGSDGLLTSQVAQLAREKGLEVEIVPPAYLDGKEVSSTRIRAALQEGDVRAASQMLGSNYQLRGIVVPGNQIGRTMGFPTANSALSFPLKAVPGNGVYATQVTIGQRVLRGMTNIGVRPTVSSSSQRVIETNIFDFDEDIYGLEISLSFIERIRGEQKFASLTELGAQLSRDRAECKKLF